MLFAVFPSFYSLFCSFFSLNSVSYYLLFLVYSSNSFSSPFNYFAHFSRLFSTCFLALFLQWNNWNICIPYDTFHFTFIGSFFSSLCFPSSTSSGPYSWEHLGQSGELNLDRHHSRFPVFIYCSAIDRRTISIDFQIHWDLLLREGISVAIDYS